MSKVAKRPMTAERFLRRGYTQGFEFVNGRMQEKTMGFKASWVQGNLVSRLNVWSEFGRLGFAVESEGMYQCFAHAPEQVRKPDVSFVRRGRLPGDVLPETACPIPPDLMAEVVSPNEKVYELNGKVSDFRRAGVPLIWVINPDLRTVTVYRDGKVTDELTAADELTGDPVLPGFRVKVADLFLPAPPAGS
jgi:Uma2 family endonuclease